MTNPSPTVIGHRGAAGYRPENTLAAFKTAIDLGADAIEPDVVSTKDHVLIVRHENELSRTTDVGEHPEFAGRRTAKVVAGRQLVGWFTEDFTLAEIKSLRCRERFPDLRQHNTLYDGRYPIATFDEVVSLARTESARTGRAIGIYPEIKHPAYFRSIGLPLEPPLVDTLRRHGLDRAYSPVVVQSFGAVCLRDVNADLDVPLVQLVGLDVDPHLLTPVGLREISTYANAVGVHKQLLSRHLVAEAHSAGLRVLVYTLRNENAFLDPCHRQGDDPRAYGDAFASTSGALGWALTRCSATTRTRRSLPEPSTSGSRPGQTSGSCRRSGNAMPNHSQPNNKAIAPVTTADVTLPKRKFVISSAGRSEICRAETAWSG